MKTLKTVMMAMLLCSGVRLAWADGMFVPSEDFHLRSPQQKAAIAWDGTTEQMVLSSKVQSEKVSDMAWIVPIESKSQPRVDKSDIAVFKDLAALFGTDEPGNFFGQEGVKAAGNGVEVLEEKKVDIYDIAVIKGTSGADIAQWLDINGYKTPPEAKTILDVYAQKPGMYFVANRIDLKNKYAADELKAQTLYSGIKRLLDDKKKPLIEEHREAMKVLKEEMAVVCPSWKTFTPESDWDQEYFMCQIDKVRERLVQTGKSGVEYVPQIKSVMSVADIAIEGDVWVSFWLVDDYDGKRASAMISYKQQQLLHIDLWKKVEVGNLDRRTFSYIPADILDRIEQSGNLIAQVFRGGWETRSQICGKNMKQDQFEGELDDVAARMGQASPSQLYCGAEQFRSSFPPIVAHVILKDVVWPDGSVVQGEYCQAITALGEGLTTPLKISFEPSVPYYPLAISATGYGDAFVEVYLIAAQSVVDQNNVLGSSKVMPLDAAMKDKLSAVFGAGPWAQATRLSWSGELKSLKVDAVFKDR